MSAPVLTVPSSYRIAARPTREGLYDSEVFSAGSTLETYSYFQNTRSFMEPGFGPKTLLDTNMVGPGGSITRGYYFRWFGLQQYQSCRDVPVVTAAGFDDQRKVLDSCWLTLMLGATPYMSLPGPVPSGTGLNGPLASGEVGTFGSVQMGFPDCSCYNDVTVPARIRKQTARGVEEIRVPRVPIELAETESFGINLNFGNVRPVTTIPIYTTINMVGIMLKPLAG